MWTKAFIESLPCILVARAGRFYQVGKVDFLRGAETYRKIGLHGSISAPLGSPGTGQFPTFPTLPAQRSGG